MSWKISEKRWKTALSSILEELDERQLRKLLFYLDKIPQGVKKGKAREEIPSVIIEHYGTEGSISRINTIMKTIPRKDAAVQKRLRPFVEKLKKKRQEEKGPSGAIQQKNVPTKDSDPSEDSISSEDCKQSKKNLPKDQAEYVKRVSNADPNQLLDKLLEQGFINDEERQSVRTKTRDYNAQAVIHMVQRKGPEACSHLDSLLCEVDHKVSGKLKLIRS
ncbi:uncharacterized protein LOC120543691 [Perca fluviatilis]|uniref:uncharacterized protein LOC120543691 n=1 Tax=Perca fluviatilis TaxID=8168 RepID=UPI0019637C81|nr:uncharacterized protein LOC120543691 [Perca fluviatilis]